MKFDYDIVIIGGGLVGASLACALGGGGMRIAVVEAVPLAAGDQPSYDDRTVTLAYGSRRIFEGIGVWRDIEQAGAVAIKRIHISDRGHFGFTRLNAVEAGLPALGYVVENRVLGKIFLAALQQMSNIHWLCPATLETIAFTADQAQAGILYNGNTIKLSSRLVIAADGVHSAVRSAVGIKVRQQSYGQYAVVTSVGVTDPQAHTAFERFTDSGPLALLPVSNNRYAVVWSAHRCETEAIMAWDEGEFLRRLQLRFGNRLGRFQALGKRQSYPLTLTRVAEHIRPRLALIGNAAHTVHPVAGQGFNLGLRDIATLSQVLVDAVAAGYDIGDVQVLRAYADWRRRDNRVILGFTDGLIRVFSDPFPPLVFARNIGLVAVDLLPPVKRGLTRITSGLAGRLPRLARGLPLT